MHHYLTNHASYLNYPHYLAKGYPIARAVIGSACRYVVKDRMEITGARWVWKEAKRSSNSAPCTQRGFRGVTGKFHEQQEYQTQSPSKFARCPKPRPHLRAIPTGKADGIYLTSDLT